MAYKVTIENEGHRGYVKYVLGVADTLKQAEDLVNEVEAKWAKWTGEEDVEDVVRDYEGCDVYATDSQTGKVWTLIDEWEEFES